MEHVPSVLNVSTPGHPQWSPECSCGWKGWTCGSRSVAQQDALTHRQRAVNDGDVEGDPRLS